MGGGGTVLPIFLSCFSSDLFILADKEDIHGSSDEFSKSGQIRLWEVNKQYNKTLIHFIFVVYIFEYIFCYSYIMMKNAVNEMQRHGLEVRKRYI